MSSTQTPVGEGRRRGPSGGRCQVGPQVDHRICPVGAPAGRAPLRRRRSPVQPVPLQRVVDAQIAGRERVGIAQGAHRHVLGGPRVDAGDRQQPPPCLIAVGARVKRQLA
jgi:hypothetical protein